MPIEIKELHIKINVNESPSSGAKPASSSSSSSTEKDSVAECVEQVMKIIERKKER
ncbi:MAG: DUF5908 family protein [Flavobacterium nitrogenifigens]|uniref:Uncharacterized protein n=1 Tax=Flavobacterium nitrogenifigens TaxID=1617283 RepID=A0A521BL39_9FLAO|nr:MULTISPECIES: DUF5908 family protein [Flavobacterium]MDQ8012991.1 DUF5908 family protein [Flavobacterium nitrogenifigens]WDF65496.1 DUF5908 family protein [Flavobacterium sp. KACC 22763]SMO47795.1 hypothetical protein SAMN06265220_1011086 [Flavobacterium nitrogenifigens]